MHQLILQSEAGANSGEPIKTAEDVMREIEDIIDEDEDEEHRGVEGEEVAGYQPPY